MLLDLTNTVFKFLQQNPNQAFTAKTIARWIFETYPEKCREKQKRSNATVAVLSDNAALLNQIAVSIAAEIDRIQQRYPDIKTVDIYPKKYYFDCSNAGIIIEDNALYAALSQFLWSQFKIYSKQIRDRRAPHTKNISGGRWLHPNLVGFENLNQAPEKKHIVLKTKLWAFEVKITINRINVRNIFFQTLSNTSWANGGYIVVNQIEDEITPKVLQDLSQQYGIGLIQLCVEAPLESKMLIPAKERPHVDWDTMNQLVEENKDFMDYVKLIRQFYQTGKLQKSDWD